jgi:transcriptional activator SPT7
MSISEGQNGLSLSLGGLANGSRQSHLFDDGPARTQTPVDNAMTLMPEASDLEEDSRRAHFADLFRKSDVKLARLFTEDGNYDYDAIESMKRVPVHPPPIQPSATGRGQNEEPPRKKVKRVIDEDDYGDGDEEDEDEEQESPLQAKSAHAAAAKSLLSPSKSGSSPVQSISSPSKNTDKSRDDGSQGQAKTTEDARKELEEARNATEEAAKRSFHTLFYTLENDRTAMLEQQQLEESEMQLQAEMDKNNTNPTSHGAGENHGSLSTANLGASSLTLKHLIARIDLKRDKVRASDAELRLLMNEVRKNRSKWASEENVGQEELYEALEKVLSELKAHTEYSTPFLQRVNKRDAPDYYNREPSHIAIALMTSSANLCPVIKHPMDLGSMTKKLNSKLGPQYKSKAEFVTDLNLIWDNCLRYNQEMSHPLRRMANGMRKEAEKLIPLIPDVVIRPRAEVEAEERRKQNGGDDDAGDDSDDEPIMSSRGRKTTGTKGVKARKAVGEKKESTPTTETKPFLQLNGLLAKTGREGSEIDGSNGISTPPIGGSITPGGMNGHSGLASNADAMDVDGPSLNGIALDHALGEAAEQVYEDDEYRIWKQVTKKDRAILAKERYQLFRGNQLNIDEPALLRSKAGMRRFLKTKASVAKTESEPSMSALASKETQKPTETLAEGMEAEAEKVIPDYYEPQTAIPAIPSKLQWIVDGEGQVIDQREEFLRMVPSGSFTAPSSAFTKQFNANIHQMQETRKLCSKISVIKQMQIQTQVCPLSLQDIDCTGADYGQVYSNQFPKYNPEPFYETDIDPHFVSGDGLVLNPEVCRAAMSRSVAKIFYNAGFEELQPSALDAATDIAGDYFMKVIKTFNTYAEAELKEASSAQVEQGQRFQPRFTPEEVLLHTLGESGHDAGSLESYVTDDVDRLTTKLGIIHERMKSYLTDLLRPALNDAGQDGVGAFKDGSEQFVGGDFAEELGEDFFGFKALGLDKELGLEMMSVPLHLLQSRMRNQYQMQTQASGSTSTDLFEALPPLEPVTRESINDQIGIIKNFFLAKLHANNQQPLVEDEDLPVKQRRPRPRLGATGKIVSPQKRPPKEQIALAKKKKKLESGLAQITDGKLAANGSQPNNVTPVKKPLKNGALPNGLPNGLSLAAPSMERIGSAQSYGGTSQTDKDDVGGMMSPESIDR